MPTQLQIMISDCPDDQAAALLRVLAQADLYIDWMEECPVQSDELHIGHAFYTHHTADGESPSDLGHLMIEAAPGASFTAWTDPNEDYLGLLVRYTPELGRHDAECDANGAAVFTEDEIMRALTGWRAGIRALVGSAWTEALTGHTVERTIVIPVEA
ncbi:MAG: hypothetical protein JWO67_3836 [Streptosporangiaceae bacterium]|nr:hypothetical protein [Streptosporangiaceae bacterium]